VFWEHILCLLNRQPDNASEHTVLRPAFPGEDLTKINFESPVEHWLPVRMRPRSQSHQWEGREHIPSSSDFIVSKDSIFEFDGFAVPTTAATAATVLTTIRPEAAHVCIDVAYCIRESDYTPNEQKADYVTAGTYTQCTELPRECNTSPARVADNEDMAQMGIL
jgi:hypothetical protein